MKTIMKKTVLFGLIAASAMLFSFKMPAGGDRVQVYFNGKLMLEQFLHVDNSVKLLQFTSTSENDKIDVYYSHCGQVGRNRHLTIRDENGEPLHVWKFPDAANGNGVMSFTVKDVSPFLKKNENRFTISYSSQELPKGRSLATISLGNSGLTRN